jgi:aryl-alcohol dehydrogenase-like predicted oxidoreductase
MHNIPNVFSIVSRRKAGNLKDNIEVLRVTLSDEYLLEVDNEAPFDIGFQMNFIF